MLLLSWLVGSTLVCLLSWSLFLQSLLCTDHCPSEPENTLSSIAVFRRVYVNRDENQQVARFVVFSHDAELSAHYREFFQFFQSSQVVTVHGGLGNEDYRTTRCTEMPAWDGWLKQSVFSWCWNESMNGAETTLSGSVFQMLAAEIRLGKNSKTAPRLSASKFISPYHLVWERSEGVAANPLIL